MYSKRTCIDVDEEEGVVGNRVVVKVHVCIDVVGVEEDRR